MIAYARFHGRGNSQRLMNPAEIVVHVNGHRPKNFSACRCVANGGADFSVPDNPVSLAQFDERAQALCEADVALSAIEVAVSEQ